MTMIEHNRGNIYGETVKSAYPYIVYGSVRGLVSEHRTLSGATRSMLRDASGCASLGGGAYSDASIWAWTEDGWVADGADQDDD